ncbi:hypothetical protein DFQ26_003895 [Actinomortierella ambigua]|nr:hypothetical protein DFQ26_003895 [Actinomortierella ambigua]
MLPPPQHSSRTPFRPALSATQQALELPEILANIAHWTEPAEAIECLRVCRAWHGHFLAIVWRSLALFRHDILEAPADAIVAAHGPLVQDLALYIYPRESTEVLARLERFARYMARLQELKFRIVGGTDSYSAIAHKWLVANRRTLRRFCWSTTRDARKPTRILDAVQYFPSAMAAACQHGGGGSGHSGCGGTENVKENGNKEQTRAGMERLQSLTLEGWDLTMTNLWHLLHACPRLSSIALHRNHFLDQDEHDEDHHNGVSNIVEQHQTLLPMLVYSATESLGAHSWSHSTTEQHSPPAQQLYQHLFPEVRILQTEGEMPPMLLLRSFPNLEQWTARELVGLDSRRLARQIQCSNMCSTLTCLDLQRAFSPDMIQDEDDEGEEDWQEEEQEGDSTANDQYQSGGFTNGDTSIAGSTSPTANTFHPTVEAVPPTPTAGPGNGPSNNNNNNSSNTIDLVPVLRAIHKDTLKILRLSRWMLPPACLRVLCEQHGQSLEQVSLEYARIQPRRRPRPRARPPHQQPLVQQSLVGTSLSLSSLPPPSPHLTGHGSTSTNDSMSNNNHSDVPGTGSTNMNGQADITTTPNTDTSTSSTDDVYLNILLESCPNLQSLRVWQHHRTYGSVRLWNTTWQSSSSSSSPSSSTFFSGPPPSSSPASSATTHPHDPMPDPHLRPRLIPTPAWACTHLRELEIQIDDWVPRPWFQSLSVADQAAAAAAIDRMLIVEMGAVPPVNGLGSSAGAAVMGAGTTTGASGKTAGEEAWGSGSGSGDDGVISPLPSSSENNGATTQQETDASIQDFSMQQIKLRLGSLPRLKRVNLGTGWYTFV